MAATVDAAATIVNLLDVTLVKSFSRGVGMGVILLALGGLASLLFRPEPAPPALPNPNGYDQFVQAAERIVPPAGEPSLLPIEKLRAFVQSNAPALTIARAGLAMECRVPPRVSVEDAAQRVGVRGRIKLLTHLFLAEGRLAEMDGRLDRAAECCLQAIELGHDSTRGGVILDKLVGVAIEQLGFRALAKISPQLSAAQCRDALKKLEALEASRESSEDVRRNEVAYVRRAYQLPQRLLTWLPVQRARSRALQKIEQGVRQSRTALVNLAGLACEKETGRRPKGWDDLVPDYLSAIPLDPATGTPLDYPF